MAEFILSAFADEAGSSLAEQIAALKENGIGYIEPRNIGGKGILTIPDEELITIKSELDKNGIRVNSLGSPIGKYPIEMPLADHLIDLERAFRVCEILDTKNIRMFSFFIPKDHCASEYATEVISRLKVMAALAKERNIQLCHENEKGIYGSIASRCLEIHKTFPELKAVYDPANFIQCGQDTKEGWEMLAPYVEYMHIKDAMPNGSVVPAGKGVGNLPYLLSEYKGEVLTVEPHLSVFEGFEQLEAAEKAKRGYCYPTRRAAFDAAVRALKELI